MPELNEAMGVQETIPKEKVVAFHRSCIDTLYAFSDAHEDHLIKEYGEETAQRLLKHNGQRQLLEDLIAMCDIDPAEAVTMAIKKRPPHDKDRQRMLDVEDPGFHIAITRKDNSIVHISAYGGMRQLSTGDVKDGQAHGRTLGTDHATITERILTKPRWIGINVQESEGEPPACVTWIFVGSLGSDQVQLTTANMNYGGVESRLSEPIVLDSDVRSYVARRLRQQSEDILPYRQQIPTPILDRQI